MKLLCDENVDQHVVDDRRRAGHDVTYIAEISPSVDDETILADANHRGAILVTSDRDFGEHVFRQRKITGGVLLVRLGRLTPERRGQVVAAAVRDHGAEMVGVFTVISPGLIRYRRQPSAE